MMRESVLVESFYQHGEASRRRIRVRPVPGQKFPPSMRVQCPETMNSYPVGTKFILNCAVLDKEGGEPFLSHPWQWPYRVVTEAEAQEFLRNL